MSLVACYSVLDDESSGKSQERLGVMFDKQEGVSLKPTRIGK
jgi:hypothetical protein